MTSGQCGHSLYKLAVRSIITASIIVIVIASRAAVFAVPFRLLVLDAASAVATLMDCH